MKLKVLGSGSDGNCYLLSHNGQTLILDCGLTFKEIKIGLNFNLSSVVGVLVSHFHRDHLLSAKDFEKSGFNVWKPYENESEKIWSKHFGDFKVTCFDVPHDGVENRGFLIDVCGEKLLYATDYEYIPYNFKKREINHLLIECNYIDEMVDRSKENYEHVIKGHSELKTAIGVVESNKTDKLLNVIFCHLSNENCSDVKVIEQANKIVSCRVLVARKGVETELSLPF